MNAVIYYSNTGQSKRVAQYFAEKKSFALFDIYELTEFVLDTAILVFPVHCQSVPDCVKEFLKKLTVENLALIATYGRMCYGNALNYIQKHYPHNIVAAAYVPAKHTYLNESGFGDFGKLDAILSKTDDPSPVKIPKAYKNPFADFLKGVRTRACVKIYRDGRCNDCGTCVSVCKNSAIENGKTNGKCIRCLKCVESCPENALHFRLNLPMRLYLKKKKRDDLIIYV